MPVDTRDQCSNSWQIALTRLERDSQLLHQLDPCSIFTRPDTRKGVPENERWRK